MISAIRLRAETRFAEIEKRQQRALNEQEQISRAVDENTARLKALRLAKEARERLEAEAKRAAKLVKRPATAK
ncbi:MAG TPA: hypothetical protein VGM83_20100 [Devosiaceae bacterium]|jgi:hypothetical protein